MVSEVEFGIAAQCPTVFDYENYFLAVWKEGYKNIRDFFKKFDTQ